MKTRNLLLLLGLLLSTALQAAPVDMEQARKQAADFLMKRAKSNTPIVMQRVELEAGIARRSSTVATSEPFYLFNATRTQGGYVVVSGDDRVPAILGYSETGTLSTDNMPENMKAFLESYTRQIDYIAENNIQNMPRRALQRDAVDPMLTTTWDQGSPYNQKCPLDTRNNQRSATGCIATALAQIMNYHKYPAKTTAAIPSYTTRSLRLKVDAIQPTSIDWENMRPNYRLYSTAAQKDAVATLMFLLGASVYMDYSATGSGSSSTFVAPAVQQYFGYTGATMAERDNYTLEQWDELVYDEMTTNGPVYYAGQSVGGGHAFVIDGYDGNGYFHVNWGWSGSGNDYYLLSILNPNGSMGLGGSTTEDGFAYMQDILVGLNPKVKESPLPTRLTTGSMRVYGRSNLQRSASGNFDLSLRAMLYNMTSDDATFDYGMAIINDKGQTVSEKSQGTRAITSYYGYELALTNSVNLTDGHYKAVAISKVSGQSKWQINNQSNNYAADIVVSGDNATITGPSIDLVAGEWKATGNTAPGNLIPLSVTLTNNGSDFYRELYLVCNNAPLAARRLDLKAGETKDFEIEFGTTDEGTIFLQLCYVNSQQSYVPVAHTAMLVARKGGGIVDGERLLTFNTSIVALSDGVMKANAEGKSTVTANINITNRGMADYKDVFGADLFDANGKLLQTKQQEIDLKVNDYTSTQLAFTEVPNEASYQVMVWYKDTEGKKIYDEQQAFSFSITAFMGIEHNLNIKMTLSNYNTRTKKLTNANPHLTLQITNKGSYEYNDQLLVRICSIVNQQPVDIGKNFNETLKLAVGEQEKREYDFTGLKNGEPYAVMADYITEGKMTSLLNYLTFLVDDPNADGISEIVASMGADKTVSVYNLNGRLVARVKGALLQQTLQQLPKAVYVIEGAKMHN